MLKIRLQRTGRKNDPSYRVVVTEHTRGPKSEKHVDRVGFYNPKTKEKKLDEAKIKHWVSVGARASGTVHNMLVKSGIIKGETINVLPQKSPVVVEVEEKETSDDKQKIEGSGDVPTETEADSLVSEETVVEKKEVVEEDKNSSNDKEEMLDEEKKGN